MKKRFPVKKFFLCFLCICILAQPIQFYAQQPSISNVTIQDYLDRIKVLQNQVDYLGQTAYIAESTGENDSSLLSSIAFTANEAQQLINEIQTITKDISPTSRQGRSVSFLIIALSYFINALNELSVYLISDDDYEEFDALERFIYNKTIYDQTISWLGNNL